MQNELFYMKPIFASQVSLLSLVASSCLLQSSFHDTYVQIAYVLSPLPTMLVSEYQGITFRNTLSTSLPHYMN